MDPFFGEQTATKRTTTTKSIYKKQMKPHMQTQSSSAASSSSSRYSSVSWRNGLKRYICSSRRGEEQNWQNAIHLEKYSKTKEEDTIATERDSPNSSSTNNDTSIYHHDVCSFSNSDKEARGKWYDECDDNYETRQEENCSEQRREENEINNDDHHSKSDTNYCNFTLDSKTNYTDDTRTLAGSRMSYLRHTSNIYDPPPASTAAFYGPPRYDWIDIEISAAIKIQTAFRGYKTLSTLQKQGISTFAIRNHIRMKKVLTEGKSSMNATTEQTGLLARIGCGIEMNMDSIAMEYMQATAELKRAKYAKKLEEQEEYEANLRSNFRSSKPVTRVRENFEMIRSLSNVLQL